MFTSKSPSLSGMRRPSYSSPPPPPPHPGVSLPSRFVSTPHLSPAVSMIFQEVDALLMIISNNNSNVISKRILSLTRAANDEDVTLKLLRKVLDRATEDPDNASFYLTLCQKLSSLKDEDNHESWEIPSIPPTSPMSPPRTDLRRSIFNFNNGYQKQLSPPVIPFLEEPEEEYVNPFLTPRTGPPSLKLVSLNTPAISTLLGPRPMSPPLTPPKTITRSASTSTSRTLPRLAPSIHSAGHTAPRVPSNTIAPPASPSKMLPDLPEEYMYTPPPDNSSIHRWLSEVNKPASSPAVSVSSVSQLLEFLTPAYADTRNRVLACMDYTDSRSICHVTCAIAEKATESIDMAVTCAKLCVDLEGALLNMANSAIADDETEDGDDSMTTTTTTTTSLSSLTADMFKRLLSIFCWQNFESAWVPLSHRSGTDDHLVSEVIQSSPRRTVILLKFIGELFRERILSRNFAHDCSLQLLNQLQLPYENVPEPMRENIYLSPPQEEERHSRRGSSSRPRPPPPHPDIEKRSSSRSRTRSRSRSGSVSVPTPPPPPPPLPLPVLTQEDVSHIRRYAMALSVFISTVGSHLDRRDKRDVDRYMDTLKTLSVKEALLTARKSPPHEEGKIEALFTYISALRSTRWSTDSSRRRRGSSFAVPSAH